MQNMHLVFSLLFLTALVTGQTELYSPVTLAHHGGMTSTGYPFGYASTQKMTYQQVHGDLPNRPFPLKSLAWRPYSSTASHAGFSTTLTLTLGMNGVIPSAATTTYATNMGTGSTVVLNNTKVNIPAYTKPPKPPGDFIYMLPFTTPYIYNGKGVFCWEVRMHSHTQTGSLSFDLYLHSTTPRLQPGGQGCTASGAAAPVDLIGTFTPGKLTLTCNNLPGTGGAVLFVGNKNQSWGGIPLPFDLTLLGAPCALRNSIEFMIPGTGTGSTANWNLTVPTTGPDGTALYLQAAAIDLKANSLGVVFSGGLAAIWPYANQPVVRIWSNGSDTATTGSCQLTYGLVIRLSL